jgi:hypothetical protein
MIAPSRQWLWLRWMNALMVAILLVAPNRAVAQTALGTDPYRPYTGAYTSSTIPLTMDNFAAAAARERTRDYSRYANQMDRLDEDLYSGPAAPVNPLEASRRTGTPGMPYYSVNRMFDRTFERTPGAVGSGAQQQADEDFYQAEQRRAQEFRDAMNEKDPRVRAAKLRAIQQESLQAARTLNAARQTARRAQPRAAAATPAPVRGAPPSATAGATRSPVPNQPARATVAPSNRPARTALPARTTTPRTTTTTPTRQPAATTRAATTTPRPTLPARPTGETPSQILDRALRSTAVPPAPSTRTSTRPKLVPNSNPLPR